MDRYKIDRAETIATFIHICRNADPAEVLRAIFLRWPDITLDELCRGIDLTALWGGEPAHYADLAGALALFCSKPPDLRHQVVGHHHFVTDTHPIQGAAGFAAQQESLIDPDVSRNYLNVVPGVPAETKHQRELRLVVGDRPSPQTRVARDLRNGAWVHALHGLKLARRLIALVRAGIQCLSDFFLSHARDLTPHPVRTP